MSEEEIARIVAQLEWFCAREDPHPDRQLLRDALDLIEELAERIAAERQAHEATIALVDADVRSWP